MNYDRRSTDLEAVEVVVSAWVAHDIFDIAQVVLDASTHGFDFVGEVFRLAGVVGPTVAGGAPFVADLIYFQ